MKDGIETSWAVLTRAFHSILGRNVLMKSGLNSASLISSWTFWKIRGKLFVLQSFAWQARRLCVTKRTMLEVIFCVNPIFGGINIWSREKILIVRPSKCIVFTNTQTQDWLLRVLSGMRPPSPSIPEKEFLYASLKEALRLDGRSLLEQRKIEISFGGDLGYVECSIGKTRCAHKICPWYSYSKFFQSDCTSWRENGQAFTWEAIRRNHHDPFRNITHGIERVWNRTVDVYF